ncbi:MAG TPA: peptide-methionine (S)-S-oxide reductase MsrA [Polyangiaceae bacterium]|nr:peptide-methionine (S)-S-oxide reductase MsrA [Polyangiaceae bacterium]
MRSTTRPRPRFASLTRSGAGLGAAALMVAAIACHPTSSALADTNAQPGSAPSTQAMTPVGTNPGNAGAGTALVAAPGDQLAAFAEGCFWGSEDTFRHVPGVVATAVGYSGGHTLNPTYPVVCEHDTGHAETVLVEFDPKRVTYAQLLRVFWDSHDPTTPNRQGPDIGDQYRSAVFTFSPDEDATARASMAAEQKQYKSKITTEIQPMSRFWKAEEYHQQYDEKTGRHSCPLPPRKGV